MDLFGTAKKKEGAFSPLDRALYDVRPALLHSITFGSFVNLLALAGPLYMLQVYDRVLSTRGVETLIALTILLAFFYAVSAGLEMLRSRILVRAGVVFDDALAQPVFDAIQKANLKSASPRNLQALRDLDHARDFLTGQSLINFCDLLWVPIFVVAAFILHPLFGLLAIGGSVVTLFLAVQNERGTRQSLDKASASNIGAHNQAAVTFRNSEVLHAMGMLDNLRALWSQRHNSAIAWQVAASDRAGPIVAITKFNRMFLQSLVLGLGAYLAISGHVTPGAMIAASIIVGRVLTPVEQVIGNWKAFATAREAFDRIENLFAAVPRDDKKLSLAPPQGNIQFDHVSVRAPGGKALVLHDINLSLKAGSVLGIIGGSAAGKSSLARVLVGVWPLATGHIRIDGSDLPHWAAEQLGQYIGYLPQEIELFSGTVAQNIGRFKADASDEGVIKAAEIAGVHDMIQSLPEGYNTQIGDSGTMLSGGQRQRIGLARAIFGFPSIIILDEPNSNLDFVGEHALVNAIGALKARNSTVIFITHKMSLLNQADKILFLSAGQVKCFGERDDVLTVLRNLNSSAPAPAKTSTFSVSSSG